MNNKVFNRWEVDPTGACLGVPPPLRYNKFDAHFAISGLARERDDGRRLEILAVQSNIRGCGYFRQFIERCKMHYDTICVLEICNPIVEEALGRYGFTPCVEPQWDGEICKGMMWESPKEAA